MFEMGISMLAKSHSLEGNIRISVPPIRLMDPRSQTLSSHNSDVSLFNYVRDVLAFYPPVSVYYLVYASDFDAPSIWVVPLPISPI